MFIRYSPDNIYGEYIDYEIYFYYNNFMKFYYVTKPIQEETQRKTAQPIFLFLYEDNDLTVPAPPHAHEYTEIFYITHGEGKMAFSNTSIPYKPHDVFVIPKYVKHNEITATEKSGYLVVAVDNDYPFLDSAGIATTPVWYSYDSPDNLLLKLMNQIRHELSNPETFIEYDISMLVSLMFTEIMRKFPLKSEIQSPNIKLIHDYISTNFYDNITLKSLAKLRFTSTVQLGREFKKAYGCTPMQFLTQKRIEHAKQILKSTNATITNVSISVGYSSPAYFAYVFMKETGETPTEYRNKNSYDFRTEKPTQPRY